MSQMEDKWRYATTLARRYPSEAAKFMAEVCDPSQLRQRVEISRYEQDDLAMEQRLNPFHASPHLDMSHPQNAPFHPHPDRYPPSPPSTTSAGRSNFQNVKLRNIIAFSIHHDEEPLSMREYPGRCHLIREDIVEDRMGFDPEECPNGHLYVQYNGRIRVSQQVALTWRQNDSHNNKTHKDVFYLVADLLDADVLLGTNEAGHPTNATRGRTPDPAFAGVIAQPVPRRHGQPNLAFRQAELSDSYHPSSDCTAIPASHSSQHHYGNGSGHAPVERPGRSTPDRLRGPGRQMTGSPLGGSVRSASPGNASNMSHSSRQRGQTPSNYPTASSTLSQTSQTSDVLRIEYIWDDVRRKGKLDLGAGGEDFFLTVQQYFILFNRTLERTHHVLFIAETEPGKPDQYALTLDESDLRDDFEDIVEWIKRLRSNHPVKLRAIIK